MALYKEFSAQHCPLCATFHPQKCYFCECDEACKFSNPNFCFSLRRFPKHRSLTRQVQSLSVLSLVVREHGFTLFRKIRVYFQFRPFSLIIILTICVTHLISKTPSCLHLSKANYSRRMQRRWITSDQSPRIRR